MDGWLIDKFDSGMAWLQRRGCSLSAVLLYEWKLQATTLLLSMGFSVSRFDWAHHYIRESFVLFFYAIFAALYAIGTWGEIKRHERDRDYMENARKTLSLNARVVVYRDVMRMGRYFDLFLFPYLIVSTWTPPWVGISETWSSCIVWTIFCLCAVSRDYLVCCTFVGPGEHARERETSLSRDMAAARKR